MTDPAATETQPKSALWVAFRIFDEPTQVFKELAARPRWVVPIVALIIVSAFSAFVTPTEVFQDQTREQLEAFMEGADEETQARLQESIDEAGGMTSRISMVAGAVIGGPIVLAIIALVLMLIFSASSAEPLRFKDEFAIVTHAGMVGLAGAVLTVCLVAFAGLGNVQFSLGFLFSSESGGFLYRFANGINAFGAWNVYLLALGNQVRTGGKSIGGPLMIVGGLWLLVKVVVALVIGLFAGLAS